MNTLMEAKVENSFIANLRDIIASSNQTGITPE